MLPRIQSGAHGILPSWKPSLRDTQTLGGSSANWSPRCPSIPQDAELPTSPLYYLMLGTESWVWAMLTALYTLRFMAHTETGMPVPVLDSNLPPSLPPVLTQSLCRCTGTCSSAWEMRLIRVRTEDNAQSLSDGMPSGCLNDTAPSLPECSEAVTVCL